MKTNSNQHKSTLPSKGNENKRNTTSRRTLPKGHRHIFLGYCFSCNNFRHKAVNCRVNERNTFGCKSSHKRRISHDSITSHDPFAPLMAYNMECYKCHNPGHKAREYRSSIARQEYNVKCYKWNNYGHIASNCELLNHSMKTSTPNIHNGNLRKI